MLSKVRGWETHLSYDARTAVISSPLTNRCSFINSSSSSSRSRPSCSVRSLFRLGLSRRNHNLDCDTFPGERPRR